MAETRFTVAHCALVSTVRAGLKPAPCLVHMAPARLGLGMDGGRWVGLIWLGLAIVGLVTVARWLFRGTGTERRSSSSALAILEERYARGDINREEYEQRRRDLTIYCG